MKCICKCCYTFMQPGSVGITLPYGEDWVFQHCQEKPQQTFYIMQHGVEFALPLFLSVASMPNTLGCK